jgi:anti-sigma regulatory factor (Ser/Thr protein kinase)
VTRDLSLNFESVPDAAGAARSALASLHDRLEPALVDDVRLLATELVTNSVRHAGGTLSGSIGFQVSISAHTVRIEVTDAGPGFDTLSPTPGRDGASGWGLYLVDRLADRWGVEREDGTRVWFEIDRPPVSSNGSGARAAAA